MSKEQEAYAKALADYNQAIELNPQYAEAYNNRGMVYLNLSSYYKLALSDFNNYIQYAKDNELKKHVALLAHSIALSIDEFKTAREYVKKAFEHATTEEQRHSQVYFDNIEHTEDLYNEKQTLEKARKKHEKLLREYTHMLGNTLFPETVRGIAESLKKQGGDSYYAKRLHDVYHSELTTRRQAELLKVRYFANNANDFISLVKQGRLLPESSEKGVTVREVLDYVLERMVARLLNEHYDKLRTERQQVVETQQTDLVELRDDFEHHVFLSDKPVLEWINQRLMPMRVTLSSPKWEKVRFNKDGTTEALFYNYFNELLLNAFKYADYAQGMQLNLYQQEVDGICFLYFSIENTCRANIVSGTQIGLKGLREDLTQLNATDAAEKSVQVIQENGKFKVIMAFNKDLLLYELTAERKAIIKSSFERLMALKKQQQAA